MLDQNIEEQPEIEITVPDPYVEALERETYLSEEAARKLREQPTVA